MADDDGAARFLELAEVVTGMHKFLAELLLDLPVPIRIPSLAGEDGILNTDAVVGLDRARALLDDEPIGDRPRSALDQLILDWLTAYEMLGLVQAAGPAPWRMDCVDYSLARIATVVALIGEDFLKGDES